MPEPNIAHLSGGFMISSIVGFLISAVYVYPASNRWGLTFAIFFMLMFISSMISMTYGPDSSVKYGKK
jgi:multisubunit Na+/H+ antiporter MnhE subunit